MNHKKILLRAWSMLWQSRALWLFGFLFVLAGGGGTTSPAGATGGGNGGAGGGGGGGGKADMAQAGGKDKNKLYEALGVVKSLVQKSGH